MDCIERPRLLTPQLARGETNRVDMLRSYVEREALGVRVGEVEHTLVAHDRAAFATGVARQARMTDGVHVAGAHRLANFETRRRTRDLPRSARAGDHVDLRGGDERSCLGPAGRSSPAFEFGRADNLGIQKV